MDAVEKPRFTRPLRRITIAVIVCAALVATWGLLYKLTQRDRLDGLLIDLELRSPDPGRCGELREVLVVRLPLEAPALSHVQVVLEYVHFTDSDEYPAAAKACDFVLLSPQATPWHKYSGEAGIKLEKVKALVRDLVMKERKPVLGICGGHQFLALAFGGTVGFIDPRLVGTFPEQYPREALSERGLVQLQILQDDPIFAGITTYPGSFSVMQSHYEEVKNLPESFVNLAESPMSRIQLMRIPGMLVYGTAFHPERGWNPGGEDSAAPPAGKQILINFLAMALDRKRSSH